MLPLLITILMPYFTYVKCVLPLKFPSLDFRYLKDISAMYK